MAIDISKVEAEIKIVAAAIVKEITKDAPVVEADVAKVIKIAKGFSKATWLKIVGVGGIVIGSACLYFAGVGASAVTAIVGAVFALAAVIAIIFGVGKAV